MRATKLLSGSSTSEAPGRNNTPTHNTYLTISLTGFRHNAPLEADLLALSELTPP